MKVTLKYYKFFKIKEQLKKNEMLLFYYLNDSHSKTWFRVEKLLKRLNLEYYKLQNGIAKKSFHGSIYKKFKNLVNGPIIIITFSILANLLLSTFFKINKILIFIGVKLNTSFYLQDQLKIIQVIRYKKTMVGLCNILKKKIKSIIKILFVRNNVI